VSRFDPTKHGRLLRLLSEWLTDGKVYEKKVCYHEPLYCYGSREFFAHDLHEL
jgi:hypothetical protein